MSESDLVKRARELASEFGTSVECTVCRRRKAPRGRSVDDEMANSMCDRDCPGNGEKPYAGDLWPGESRIEFGFPTEYVERLKLFGALADVLEAAEAENASLRDHLRSVQAMMGDQLRMHTINHDPIEVTGRVEAVLGECFRALKGPDNADG